MRISEIDNPQSNNGPGTYEVFQGNRQITTHKKVFRSYEDAVKYFNVYHVWGKDEGPEIPPYSIRKVSEPPKPATGGPGYYVLFYKDKPHDMYDEPKFFRTYDEAQDWYTKYRIDYSIKNKGTKPEDFSIRLAQDAENYYLQLPTPSKNPNNILSDPEYYREALKFWISYWGEGNRKGTLELREYSNDVDTLDSDGGTVYRVVFLRDFSELNREELGWHWTVDYDIAARDYASGAEGQHHQKGGKNVAVLLTCKTPPNNVTNKTVDVRGNPEEKEVNIINPRICKFTAQVIGTKEVIALN